jgi:starch synthase
VAVTLTLHNLAYHGWTGLDHLGELGLAAGDPLAGANPAGLDLLLTAIERSDLANTVSPGFAAEALTPAFGMGLDATLRGLGDRFFGILNGIDPDVWDPATDPALATPFSRADTAGKAGCRRDLLGRNGMDPDDDGVVLGMIGRMDPQKGFDLLADGVADLLADGTRVIVQGSGHASLADPFRALAAANPGRVALIERFDRDMARRIYAGADLFLMPSRFEPCGLNQMYSLLYGSVPVVREVGGLKDTVVDLSKPGGTGVVFGPATADALFGAMMRAVELYRDPVRLAEVRARGMSQDLSWQAAARNYEQLLRR